ncbi:MAG: TOBE domain-containing protein, partial [Desulfurococcales archaeon]|nr:TOBE domain-containing protein [Desulfurococcales archaeon]
TLKAVLTPSSLDLLRIEEGVEVYLMFKAASVKAVPY